MKTKEELVLDEIFKDFPTEQEKETKNPDFYKEKVVELLMEIETLQMDRKKIQTQIWLRKASIRFYESQEIADFLEKNQNQLNTTPKNFDKIIRKIRKGI